VAAACVLIALWCIFPHLLEEGLSLLWCVELEEGLWVLRDHPGTLCESSQRATAGATVLAIGVLLPFAVLVSFRRALQAGRLESATGGTGGGAPPLGAGHGEQPPATTTVVPLADPPSAPAAHASAAATAAAAGADDRPARCRTERRWGAPFVLAGWLAGWLAACTDAPTRSALGATDCAFCLCVLPPQSPSWLLAG
jgi:hypothetical protein